jgi:tetratricopeptide (TPR) repeat protein
MGLLTTERTVEERLQEGVAFKNEGRYEEAERLFRAVLDSDPLSHQTRRELALVMNFTGRFEESIEELRRTVATAPHYLEARVDLALAYSMLGYMDEAKTELEEVLAVDPTHPAALRHIVYFR